MRFEIAHIPAAHSDSRRRLTAIFNGDFLAWQVKIIEVKSDAMMGNHYHDYRELFYILQGQATFALRRHDALDVPAVWSQYTLQRGDRLIIQAGIIHQCRALPGTIIIEATEQPYVNAEQNDKQPDEGKLEYAIV